MVSAAQWGTQQQPAAQAATRVIKKIGVGQQGAQRWARHYGDQLLCVRYRECPDSGERLVTVEIVVDRRNAPQPPDQPVAVRIERHEAELRALVKSAGATFDWKHRVWVMPRRLARSLRLVRRIVPEATNTVGSGRRK